MEKNYFLPSKACSGVLSLIGMMDIDTFWFLLYFGVALLFKSCTAAEKLEVQNNVCEKDPPMYSKVIIF